MKYMKQFMIILGVTCIGEIIKYFVHLPIPASIYGLILMLILLMKRVVRVEDVKETGSFLIEIMSLMFIPAGVGLITVWKQVRDVLLPICAVTVITTFLVMAVTGKVSDYVLSLKGADSARKPEGESDESNIG